MRYLKVKKCFPDAQVPKRATPGSAGFDIFAYTHHKKVVVWPGEAVLVSSGVSIWIENPGLVGLMFPRSGMGHKKGLILGNGTGVIDSDYQGDLLVSCCNRSEHFIEIEHGQRIAQLVVVPIPKVELTEVAAFDQATGRGSKGLGSTGV